MDDGEEDVMRSTVRHKADFDRYGAVLMKDVVPVRWLRVLEQATERDIAEPGPYFNSYWPAEGRFHGNLRIWENDVRAAKPSAARGRSGRRQRGSWAPNVSTSSTTSSSQMSLARRSRRAGTTTSPTGRCAASQ